MWSGRKTNHQFGASPIWCLTKRCLIIFVVDEVNENLVLQWLHMASVLSDFFMKCFQTLERPRGMNQSSQPLSSCINRSRVKDVTYFGKSINMNNKSFRDITIYYNTSMNSTHHAFMAFHPSWFDPFSSCGFSSEHVAVGQLFHHYQHWEMCSRHCRLPCNCPPCQA